MNLKINFPIAIVGKGKTGHYLENLIPKEFIVGPFDSKHTVKDHFQEFCKAKCAIIFTTGSVFLEMLPLLIESKLIVINAATGFQIPSSLDLQLKEQHLTWCYSANFAPGHMRLFSILEYIGSQFNDLDIFQKKIVETHHIDKKDKPSGTALFWKSLIEKDNNQSHNQEIEITSHRVGDHFGEHSLHIESYDKDEEIIITHKAKNRRAYAYGALLMAMHTHNNKNNLPYGYLQATQILKITKGSNL